MGKGGKGRERRKGLRGKVTGSERGRGNGYGWGKGEGLSWETGKRGNY